jgi:hypothetical protein
MAINKNHEFEELNGIKCAIVEKNVSASRVEFLKNLLEFNGYTVVAIPSPAPKAAPPKPAAAAASGDTAQLTSQPLNESTPPPPATFTVGVTDITFNPINAVFGRLLRTPDKHVVTLAYWQQKETVSHDEVPYFEGPLSP